MERHRSRRAVGVSEEVPQGEMLQRVGPSLVVSALTEDEDFVAALLDSPKIERLNFGDIPTSQVAWDQPHEGSLFDLLYRRRSLTDDALARASASAATSG